MNLREQLKPGLREWLEKAHERDEYPKILEFRHWFTHKAVSRSATVFLGQDRTEYKSGVADYDEESAIEHLRMAARSRPAGGGKADGRGSRGPCYAADVMVSAGGVGRSRRRSWRSRVAAGV